jgi:hypothetical protein
MLTLIQFNGPLLAVCVALGAATSWWVFRGERARPRNKEETKP